MKNGRISFAICVFIALAAILTFLFCSCGCIDSGLESGNTEVDVSSDVPDPTSEKIGDTKSPGPDETSSPDETLQNGKPPEPGETGGSGKNDGQTETARSGGKVSTGKAGTDAPPSVPETGKNGETSAPVQTSAPETREGVETTSSGTTLPEIDVPETEDVVPEDFEGIVFRVTSDKKTVKPGDTLTLNVDVVKNPGFFVMVVDIGKASGNLTLTGIEGNKSSGCSFVNDKRSVIDSKEYRNCVYTGNLLTFKYTVSENAVAGRYKLTASCDASTISEKRLESFFILPTIVITGG